MASVALVKVVRGQLPKRRPFTATAVETRNGSDGAKAYQDTFAVRSDGSQAKAVKRRERDGNWYEMRMVVDIPGVGARAGPWQIFQCQAKVTDLPKLMILE